MEKPEQLVRLSHSSDPGIPSRIQQAIAQASQCEDGNDGRVRRMSGKNDITDGFAGRCDDRDATPADEQMQTVAEQSSYRVTGERRKEDQ